MIKLTILNPFFFTPPCYVAFTKIKKEVLYNTSKKMTEQTHLKCCIKPECWSYVIVYLSI